jgi:hypothetical protein
MVERSRARVLRVDLQHHGSRGRAGGDGHREAEGHRQGFGRVRKGGDKIFDELT